MTSTMVQRGDGLIAVGGTEAEAYAQAWSQVGYSRLGIFYNGASPAFSLLVDGANTVASESIGSGNGAKVTFTGTLAHAPVTASSLTFSATNVSNAAMTVTDDGSGALTGDGTGTIDYATGVYSVTFSAAVKNATTATAGYDYGVALSAGPAAGQVWRDVELTFIFAGGTSMPMDGICGSATAFASGIAIAIKGESIGLLAPRTNADFAGSCDRVEKFTHTDPWGVVYVYKIASVLDGDAGDTITLTISEDATTLTTLSQATPILRYRTLG